MPKNLSCSAIQDVKVTRSSITIECLSSWEAGKQVGDGRPQGDAVKPSAGFEVLQRPELGHGTATAVPQDHHGQRRIGDLAQGKSDFVDFEMQTVGTQASVSTQSSKKGKTWPLREKSMRQTSQPSRAQRSATPFQLPHSLNPLYPWTIKARPRLALAAIGAASIEDGHEAHPNIRVPSGQAPWPPNVQGSGTLHSNPRPSKALEETVR